MHNNRILHDTLPPICLTNIKIYCNFLPLPHYAIDHNTNQKEIQNLFQLRCAERSTLNESDFKYFVILNVLFMWKLRRTVRRLNWKTKPNKKIDLFTTMTNTINNNTMYSNAKFLCHIRGRGKSVRKLFSNYLISERNTIGYPIAFGSYTRRWSTFA